MSSLIEQYHREIDDINNRINEILCPPQVESADIPTHFIFLYIAIFLLLTYLLTKLEWKTKN